MSRPATPTAAPANATVPSTFLRCFRGAASFNALARVWDGKTAKVEEIHDEMGHKFFGQVETDTLSSLNKLIKGEEAFYALFDEHPSPSGSELVTKPHLTGGCSYIIGVHLTFEPLGRSAFTKANSPRITGRALYQHANSVILANCKKAQSLVPKLVGKVCHLAPDGTICGYVSGNTEINFLEHINDGMFMLLSKKAVDTTGEEEAAGDANGGVTAVVSEEVDTHDDNASVNNPSNLTTGGIGEAVLEGDDDEFHNDAADMTSDNNWMPFGGKAPPGYRFPGYCCYAAYGPHTSYFNKYINPKGHNETDKADKKKNGRSNFRANEAKKAKVERSYGTDRGMSMDNKIAFAGLAQNDEAAAMRDREGKFAMLRASIAYTSGGSSRLMLCH
jgi:hypothetical protein